MKEDLFTENKSSFSDAVIETLVAFANTRGGQVFIGLSDAGTPVKGFSIGAESIQKWVNEIRSKTHPSVIPDAETLQIAGIDIVKLSVKEFPVKPVAFRGRYFKRVSNSNHPLSLTEIADLHLRSFNTSWDSYVNPKYRLEDLSLEKVLTFITRCNEDKETPNQDDPLSVLKKYELVVKTV